MFMSILNELAKQIQPLAGADVPVTTFLDLRENPVTQKNNSQNTDIGVSSANFNLFGRLLNLKLII